MATDMTVANTIYKQIGGGRLKVMTGAKNFSGDANSLSFRIPRVKGPNGSVNYVKITLNSMDLYDMSFGYIHGMKFKEDVTVSEGNYADMLQSEFTANTGLYTSL